MGRSRLRRSSPVHPSLFIQRLSPPSSLHEDWDTETAMDTSRPTSLAIPRTASPFISQPSLQDILSDCAPPPWTLSAFTAFMSHNHCLETLEFILDAERYKYAYFQHLQGMLQVGSDEVASLWAKIIEAYIMPCAPREVNLPAHVRDRLLNHPYTPSNPIDPSELDDAVQIVRELMSDSVLVPFLESVMPAVAESYAHDDAHESRQGRSRLRTSRDLAASGDDSSQSPISTFLPLFGIGRHGGATQRSHSGSTETMELDLTDDSNSPNSTPGAEPMTPPTTPPNADFAFGASPNTLHRALTGNSWRRVGAKLGLGRKSKSGHRATQSGPTSAQPGFQKSWEDPHPGERYIPYGTHTGSHVRSEVVSGNLADAVAAKAQSACGKVYWTRRRNGRLSHRNTIPKPLKIPAQVPEETEAKSAPVISSRPCAGTTPSTPFFLPLFEPLRPIELGRNTDTEVGTEPRTLSHETAGDAEVTVVTPGLSDFSNYLGIMTMDDDDVTSVTVVDADSFTRTSSVEDLYGWDAELDRKLCEVSGANAICDCQRCPYQRDGGKRNLIQRVFSTPGRRVHSGI
ncbi:hypothetical protein F4778DRAFT_792583 [Xylariomycetidae sp. FL2044]|nr:hypothetical protein F4778DRAFT_792583 [Xylariomycetidae sp. FL2044]